jgi:hypothetical protein
MNNRLHVIDSFVFLKSQSSDDDITFEELRLEKISEVHQKYKSEI